MADSVFEENSELPVGSSVNFFSQDDSQVNVPCEWAKENESSGRNSPSSTNLNFGDDEGTTS